MLASFLVLQWKEKALPAKSLKGYQKETWPKAINQWIMVIILNSTWPEQKYESNIWLNFFSSEVSFFYGTSRYDHTQKNSVEQYKKDQLLNTVGIGAEENLLWKIRKS